MQKPEIFLRQKSPCEQSRTLVGQGRSEEASRLHEAVGGGGQSARAGEGEGRAKCEHD